MYGRGLLSLRRIVFLTLAYCWTLFNVAPPRPPKNRVPRKRADGLGAPKTPKLKHNSYIQAL